MARGRIWAIVVTRCGFECSRRRCLHEKISDAMTNRSHIEATHTPYNYLPKRTEVLVQAIIERSGLFIRFLRYTDSEFVM